MAHRAVEALKQNCRVIVGDSPGRVRKASKKRKNSDINKATVFLTLRFFVLPLYESNLPLTPNLCIFNGYF